MNFESLPPACFGSRSPVAIRATALQLLPVRFTRPDLETPGTNLNSPSTFLGEDHRVVSKPKGGHPVEVAPGDDRSGPVGDGGDVSVGPPGVRVGASRGSRAGPGKDHGVGDPVPTGRAAGRDDHASGALLRALWDHLERPEAWAILDASAGSPDTGVVIGLARIQVDRASVAARERVADLLRRLLDHPEPTVRVAVLNRLTEQPVPDPRRALLTATLDKLASAVPDEQSAGLSAALAAATDADAPAFAAAFTRLLPQRRELAAAVDGFAGLTRPLGPRLVEVRSAVLAAVEADPAVASLQIRLAAARFAAEPFASGGIGGELPGEDLNGDVAAEGGVFGAIHLAHPSSADGREDLVQAELVARGEGHSGVQPMTRRPIRRRCV